MSSSQANPLLHAEWRTALVIGLGASGVAAATLLRDLGVDVRGYDRKRSIEGLPDGITPLLGDPQPPASAYAGIDLLVLSPGVPPQPFLAERAHWAPAAVVHGELGLALSLVPEPPPTVLVTGTNGKSTITALVGALLEADGRTPFVGGNLGDPLAGCVRACLVGERAWPSELVLECSSYQLETLPTFPTTVAMISNVTPDHIDRYATMADYAYTKARVFQGLTETGLALLDDVDAWTDPLTPRRAAFRVVRVGKDGGAWLDGDDRLRVGNDPPISPNELRIAGRHNAKNALFALMAARHLGVPADACRRGLAAFEGLPHRMRWVRALDGVDYYNDSKATNVTSAVTGLGGLSQRFVLIAGGLGKGDDLGPLRELLHARGRGLVAIGTAAPEFLALAEGKLPAELATDLREAVQRARALAKPGDVVVLAPACASFDQFRSYAHRGEVFTEAVLALQ